MNFDKFKTVAPKTAVINTDDSEYLSRLAGLPDPRPKKNILPVVGTVAAVFMALIAFTVWALIGRGVRGTEPDDPPVVVTPSNEAESVDSQTDISTEIVADSKKEYQLDEQTVSMLDAALAEYQALYELPLFSASDPLTKEEVLEYLKKLRPGISKADELNALAYDILRIKDMFTENIVYPEIPEGTVIESVYPIYVAPEYRSITEYATTSGHRMIVITYYFVSNPVYSIEYIAGDGIEVDFFVAKGKIDEIPVSVQPESEPESEPEPEPTSQPHYDEVPLFSPTVLPDSLQSIELTEDVTDSFMTGLFEKYKVLALPVYEANGFPPAVDALRYLYERGYNPQSAYEMNALVYDIFAVYDLTSEMPAVPEIAQIYEYDKVTIKSISHGATADSNERNCYVIVYEYNGTEYTLSYVHAIGIDPKHIFAHTKN